MTKSKPPIAVQAALKTGPGRFRALLTFDTSDQPAAVICVATLLKELESPQLVDKPLKVLVGVALDMLANHGAHAALSQEYVDAGNHRGTQAPVLVQIAAETEDERTYARRLVKRVFAGTLTLRQEFSGGRHGLGREPYGYQDAATANAAPLSAAAPGVSWLLFQRCEQDVKKFYTELTESQQNGVVGKQRDARADAPPFEAAADSHVKVSREIAGRLSRRSFTYETFSEEGLLFLAAAASPADLESALSNFTARDRLKDFVKLQEGGVYVVPPSSGWLSPGASLVALGDDRPPPEQPFYPRFPVVLYDMTPSTREFFLKVFHGNKDKIDERGALREDVKLLSKGMTKLLFGGTIKPESKLFKLLSKAFDADSADVALRANRAIESTASTVSAQRELHENDKRNLEQSMRGSPRPTIDSALASKDQTFAAEVAQQRGTIAAELRRPESIAAGLQDAPLAAATIGELFAEQMAEDAETTHFKSAEEKRDINEIAVLCEKAAAEARALNEFSRKYMTFIC